MGKRQPYNSFEAAISRIDNRVAFYIHLQDLCPEFGYLWCFFQRSIKGLYAAFFCPSAFAIASIMDFATASITGTETEFPNCL